MTILHPPATHRRLPVSTRRLPALLCASGLSLALALGGCAKTEKDTAPPNPGDQLSDQEKQRRERADAAAKKRAALAALPALPGVKPPTPVKFPEPVITTLDNGLEVIVLEDHESPLVDITLHVKAGDIHARADNPALARFTAYLLAEGTRKYTKSKLDALVDATGGSLATDVGDERAVVNADLLRDDAELGLKLIAEQAMRPTFPEDSLKKIKDRMIQEVAAEKAQPFGLAQRAGRRVVFGADSPYGRPFTTNAQIEAMTRAQAVAFHESHYLPNNAMLVIAGDITAARAQKLVQKHFGGWARGADVSTPRGEPPPWPDKTLVHLVDRKASAQATIMAVARAPGIGEQGWLEAKTLQSVYSGGLSGRLNQVLREQLGLTYGAGAFHIHGFDGGGFFAGGGTKTKSAAEFTEALLELLRQPGEEGVEAKELARVLSIISGKFALEVEGVGSVASKTVTQRVFGLPEDFWERYRGDVESITPAQIKASADALFVQQPVQLVVIGKAKKLAEPLRQFGEVIIYDTQLERVP